MSAPNNGLQFTTEQEKLWKACTETFATLNSYLDHVLRFEAGIKLTDFHILSALTEPGEGIVRMGDLAQRTHVSPSRLTYQIKVLLGYGWVEKGPVKNDRRGAGITITNLGKSIYEKAASIYAREVKHAVLDGLDSSAYPGLEEFFAHVQHAIKTVRL